MSFSLRKCCAVLVQSSVSEIRRNIARSTCAFSTHDITPNENNSTLHSNQLQLSKKYYRNMSTVHPTTVRQAVSGTAVSKDESREFMAVFPDVVRDLTDTGRHADIPDATKWFSKVLQYNVPGGKKNRGLALVCAYRIIAPKEDQHPENIREAQILGWCVELLQAFFLVMDDIMDNAVTRRGRPCWYRKNDLGLSAINDGILLESGLYQLLKKYFRDKPYYANILELFHDVTLKTTMGQTLDLLASQAGKKPSYEKFTMKRYNTIVKYKTAYYSFHLPVALAMHMAGFNDPEMLRQAKTILLEMGQFFQVQDDFLDCFGNVETTGKVGTDIEDGKCTWLAVVALQRANPDQRALFEEYYGSKDPSKVAAIKALYEQLGLPAMFQVFEEESYNLISTHIQQVSRGMPHELFLRLMDKIYRRES